MVGGAEDATSGIGPIEGTVGAGALMSVSNSTYCGSSGCFGCGLYESSGPIGNRYGNTRLRWMRLRWSWYYWWSPGSGMRSRGCNLSHRSYRGHCRGRCSHVSWFLNWLWLLWMLWLWSLWKLWSNWGSWLYIISCHTRPFVESE